ncbi:MAG: LamG domain-containing protein [gamma proteobacterium symbiont of Bathyaustriella thionipta]|nr:LamG domain-containing protein [gamma proteobacterium symbiont of Bathyaustriella thionipta]MCU7950428.1 LamG domain-containing protein [gamma proteobacterium symbiont of Bathyaustriella thionipta]MCU7953078.1 LamG domain-containing protein [gamma proteobacterium symbiont of Bathyaustriella thionipta]MCU7956934.1 LamG domain-containing protein [gamma proteobacterium symbiont of Bathyaustriella thionipta]MCU7965652.1 LamG domain-containing protein [gamma proteobacterium symbiont of Bathyaustr
MEQANLTEKQTTISNNRCILLQTFPLFLSLICLLFLVQIAPAYAVPQPVADWHFDEHSYSGTADEVLDSSGNNYHSIANANTPTIDSTLSGGGICRALNLTANSTQDYITLQKNAISGLNPLSISAWIKAGSTGRQQEIIQGLGSSTGDDEIEIYLDGDDLKVYFRDQNERFSLNSNELANNSWHHFVVTRNNRTVCLYIDGSLKECKNFSNNSQGALSITNNALIVGQEQDSYGGNFNSRQDFEGYIDEMMVFSSPLTAAEVQTLYNNQAAGNNCDGSSRICPPAPPVPAIPQPVADWHFDENSYSGTADEVLDSSGSNYHAIATLSTPTIDSTLSGGGICRALDLTSNSTSDYVSLPKNALDGLNSLTISAWIKAPNTGRQQEIIQGLGSRTSDDEIEVYLDGDDLRVYFRDQSERFRLNGSELVNNSWHHFAITRNGQNVCLYIDGTLKECKNFSNRSLGALSITNNALIVGQGQDSYGGNFSSRQDFEGYIDELIVFSSSLAAAQINSIYTHQMAGNNWDGSARNCAPVPPAVCTAETYGVYAGDKLELKKDITFNSATIVDNKYDNGGAIDLASSVISNPSGLENLNLINFPAPINPVPANINSPIPSGHYNEIKTSQPTLSFSGGTYYINKLKLEKDITVTFAPGDYYINEFSMKKNTSINIAPATGTVNIYIGDKLKAEKELTINSNSAEQFTLYSYQGADKIEFEDDIIFTGTIYVQDSNTELKFKKESWITGGIFSHGEVEFEKESTITYGNSEIEAAKAVLGCSSSCTLDRFTVTQPVHALACPDTPAEINIEALCSDGTTKTDYIGPANLSTNLNTQPPVFYDTITKNNVIASVTFDGTSGIADA